MIISRNGAVAKERCLDILFFIVQMSCFRSHSKGISSLSAGEGKRASQDDKHSTKSK